MSNDHHSHNPSDVDTRLNAAAVEGCEESRLLISRRAALGMSAAFCAWSFLPRSVTAASLEDKRLLIVVLRGGLDGLHVAFPSSQQEPVRKRRERIYGKTSTYLNRYISISGSGQSLKLNPSLTNFQNLFQTTQASLIHSIAPPVRSHSHFDCQDSLENGYSGRNKRTQDGWLNRLLARMSTGDMVTGNLGLTKGISIGPTPLMMRGAAHVCSWSEAGLQGFGNGFDQDMWRRYSTRSTTAGYDPYGLNRKFSSKLKFGIDVNTTAVASAPAFSGDSTVNAFVGAAALMSRNDGPRIGVLSIEGFDTHTSEIAVLDAKLKSLDDGLGRFKNLLGNAWNNTVVAVVTEFGRTTGDNAYGTDHGTGTVALLAGGAISGGQIIGADFTVPDVAPPTSDVGIAASIDTRSLFKGLLIDHLDCADGPILSNEVFPDSGVAGSPTYAPALTGLIGSSPNTTLVARLTTTAANRLNSIPLTDNSDDSTISTYRAAKASRR